MIGFAKNIVALAINILMIMEPNQLFVCSFFVISSCSQQIISTISGQQEYDRPAGIIKKVYYNKKELDYHCIRECYGSPAAPTRTHTNVTESHRPHRDPQAI